MHRSVSLDMASRILALTNKGLTCISAERLAVLLLMSLMSFRLHTRRGGRMSIQRWGGDRGN